MNLSINNAQKLNDIIFAGRNQAYGAYALRSSYGHTVFKSILLMMLGVGTLSSLAFYMNRHNPPPQDLQGQVITPDSVLVIPFSNQKDEPDSEKKEPAAGKEKPQTPQATLIADTGLTTETTDTTYAGNEAVNTLTATNGDANTGGGDGKTKPGFSGGIPGIPDTITTVNELFEIESYPEFEGGLNALYRFLVRHLKYPEAASESNKEGTVFVKFVVDETGQVGALKVLNPLGYGMDEEALRVVSMIPKFKSPAKIKNRAVKVYYQLPIRFTLNR